jgi:flagellin-specific chaperone FliS
VESSRGTQRQAGENEGLGVKPSSKHTAAFKDELNWIGTGLIIAAGFFAGFPLAIPFAWAAYEAAYMLFVPDSTWYERRLSHKADAEVERQRRSLKKTYLPSLLEEDRDRFRELEQVRREIEAQEPTSELWFREIVRKLDFLLERFLLFAHKRAQYLGYLRDLAAREDVTPAGRGGRPLSRGARDRALADATIDQLLAWLLDAYDRRAAAAQQELARETDPRTQEVLKKNLDVLIRLRANAEQIGQIARNLERQLDLVVDTFSLINGQLRTSPPEQMISDVDGVIDSSQALSDALVETAPLEQAIQRLGQSP